LLAWGTTLEPSATPGTYGPVNVPFLNGSFSGSTLLAGVSTLPAGLLVSSNLVAGTATVTVNAGQQTIVTFIDAATGGSLAIPPTAGSELAAITSTCGFIQSNGTGYGICRSCRIGALPGTKH
jgi:hypothetical protein